MSSSEFLADCDADIEPHHVGQFDRAHGHAEGFHGGVQRFGGDAFIDHAHGFVDVGSQHAIDQEAGRILHRQRQLVDLAHEGGGILRGDRVGLRTGHDFNQLHLRHRVEEVDADQSLRVAEVGRDLGKLQAGGVAGEDGGWFGDGLDLREQRALGFEVLEDGFDDHIGLTRAVAGHVGDESVGGVAQPAGIAAEALLEELCGARHGRREAFGVLVLQRHAQAAQRTPRRDVAAHDAGADHVHVLRFER